tara:strand:- start:1737 stop:4172 length:2436 start_codon:yes stop_codon:yes gene_type:complete
VAYKAEIDVSVKNLNQVTDLETKLSSISRNVNALNRGTGGGRRGGGGGGGGSSASPEKEELAVLKLQNTALTQVNRGLRAQNKLKGDGLKLTKAISDLENIAAKNDIDDLDSVRKEIEENKKILIQTEEKLIDEKRITAEVEKRAKLLKGGPTGFKADQFGPQMAPTKGAGQAAMSIDTITKQSEKRLAIEMKLRELEAQGVNTKKLRVKMGELVDAQNRRDFGDIKRINGELGKGIAKEKGKLRVLKLQNQERKKEDKEIRRTASSSALNFDKRTGKLLRGPAGSGGGGFRNLARRFDKQSALISGGFPLLFGQGPGVAAAGALGGGIGGMFGQMGGFAGGIAATAAVQAIQSTLDEISKLGQAMGAFTQDTQAMVTAMGLQGSAQEAQLRRIEKTQGKTAAFNASMKMMENRIGTSGVRKIKEFGETTRVLGTMFSNTLLKLQSFMAGMANFIARLVVGEKQLKDAEVNQTIKDAAAGGNAEAQALLDRETEIEETGFKFVGHGGSTKRMKSGTKDKLEQLEKDKQLFAVRQKVSLANDEILSKSQDLVNTKTDELDLQNRIKEEMANGTNKELATSLARINQIFDKEQEVLQNKADQSKLDEENAIKDGITGDKLQEIKNIHLANTEELEKHNKLRKDAIKLEKDLALATDSLKTNFERIGESIASGVSDNLTAAIQGTKTLGDAAKSILNDLSSSLIRLGVNTLLSKIPGFGSLPILGGRARGGPVKAGGSFVVGEKGPELFVPKRSGTIIPNDKLGGGSTNISVNIDASGSSVQGDAQQSKELGRAISAAIQSELLKQKRPGGLLR